MQSILTKSQTKTYGPKFYTEGKEQFRIVAKVRYDDQCGNGHNSFSITATIDANSGGRWQDYMGGCCHDKVAKHFPELAPFIKWHLFDSTGPMHYVANTLYWLGFCGWCDGKPNSPPNLAHARSTAVWPDMPESFLATEATKGDTARGSLSAQGLQVKDALEARTAALITEFKAAVESLGFTF